MSNPRMARLRERRRAQGLDEVTLWMSPQVKAALLALAQTRQESIGNTVGWLLASVTGTPVTVTAPGVTVTAPRRTTGQYYLGPLCKRQHDYDGQGHTLRRLPSGGCAACNLERQKVRRALRQVLQRRRRTPPQIVPVTVVRPGRRHRDRASSGAAGTPGGGPS